MKHSGIGRIDSGEELLLNGKARHTHHVLANLARCKGTRRRVPIEQTGIQIGRLEAGLWVQSERAALRTRAGVGRHPEIARASVKHELCLCLSHLNQHGVRSEKPVICSSTNA